MGVICDCYVSATSGEATASPIDRGGGPDAPARTTVPFDLAKARQASASEVVLVRTVPCTAGSTSWEHSPDTVKDERCRRHQVSCLA